MNISRMKISRMKVSRNLAHFNKVIFRGPGTLTISQGKTEQVTINAPSHVLDRIKSDIHDQQLNLYYQSPKVVDLDDYRDCIHYELQLRNLDILRLMGSGNAEILDLDNDRIKIDLDGSGNLNVGQLTADELLVNLCGSGTINISGDVEVQTISLLGSGSFQGDELVSDFASINLSGSGTAEVNVSAELSVRVGGSGQVIYSGFPDIDKVMSGTGKISRRRYNSLNILRGKNHG